MKALLTTTALALMLAPAAFAESHAKSDDTTDVMVTDGAMEQAEAQTTEEMETTETGATEMADADVTDSEPLSNANMDSKAMTESELAELTVEDMLGAPLFGANNEEIGEVGDAAIDTDGNVTHLILNVGGFIGLGEKQVEVPFEEVELTRADNGDNLRVTIQSTQEELEAMPEYDG